MDNNDSLRLMIVDDEPLARMRLRGLLADLALPATVVGEAGSAAEALHLLSRAPVDAVLLDIHMPGSDGLALARRLRQCDPAPAVVFVTAHAEHALQAFEIEAVDYLTKPVRRARLEEALGGCCSAWGAACGLSGRCRGRGAGAGGQRPGPGAAGAGAGRGLPQGRAEVRHPADLRAQLCAGRRAVRPGGAPGAGGGAHPPQRPGGAGRRAGPGAPPGAGQRGRGRGGGETWAVRLAPHGDWLAVSRRQLPAVREALASEGL
jgi:two-component system response regulator AlgR